MAKKDAIHVTYDKDKGNWGVKKENTQKASARTDTKAEAQQIAKEQGRNQKTEVITHKKNGRFQKRESYGNDPYPPKG